MVGALNREGTFHRGHCLHNVKDSQSTKHKTKDIK